MEIIKKYIKYTITGFVVFFVVLCVFIVAVAMSKVALEDDKPTQTQNITPVVNTQPVVEKQEPAKESNKDSDAEMEKIYKDIFVDACAESGNTSYSECVCSYNYIRKEISFAELMNLGQRSLNDELTDADVGLMLDAILECSNNIEL